MFKKPINLVFTLIIFSLALLFSTNVYASANRISGLNRYETSAAVALDGWKQSDYAILANGENFPDALSTTPLAQKYNAPILLTLKDTIPDTIANALQQLKVKNVFIVGGTGVISSTVENQLSSIGIKVTRLSGQNRYETDIQVAKQLGSVDKVVLVNGEDFPDALSIAPIAAKENMPILLMSGDIIPDVVKQYIGSQNISKTYLIISGSTIKANMADGLPNVELIAGSNKYERNLSIIDKFKNDLDFSTIFVASGENFPDALSGTIASGKNGNPMFLVNKDGIDVKDYLNKNSINGSNVKILGGTGAINDSIVDCIAGKVDDNEAFYYNRGKQYAKDGQFDSALSDFNKALELNPNDYVVYYNRGLVYQNKENLDKAVADYSKCIEINPNYIYAYNNRGLIYDTRREYDKALVDYNKAIQLDPTKSYPFANRGILYFNNGDYDKALTDLNQAIQLDPNNDIASAYRRMVIEQMQNSK